MPNVVWNPALPPGAVAQARRGLHSPVQSVGGIATIVPGALSDPPPSSVQLTRPPSLEIVPQNKEPQQWMRELSRRARPRDTRRRILFCAPCCGGRQRWSRCYRSTSTSTRRAARCTTGSRRA
eukprot:748037-Prymnesium_polylepis.1